MPAKTTQAPLTARDVPPDPPRCTRCGRVLSALASTTRNVGPVCEGHDGYIVSPFTIVADSNEQSGRYEFLGLREDQSRGGAEIIPQIVTVPLYQYNLADYSVRGMEFLIQIERKTLSDFYGSITHRRENFEAELAYLDKNVAKSYLLIEAEWSEIMGGTERMQGHIDPKHALRMSKTASRTHTSWSLKYPTVEWLCVSGRRFAEAKCYRLLERAWIMEMERRSK